MATLLWKTLFENLTISPSTAAYLDWATGIMRINTTHEKWFDLISRSHDGTQTPENLTTAELDLLETVTHETTHFLQIITTGFLYSLASDLYASIGAFIASVVHSSLEDEILDLLARDVPPGLSSNILSILNRLDAVGPDDVSVRKIVESAAFLVQKRTHLIGLSHEEYSKILNQRCPAPEYRHAYDVATACLGKDAFDLFPLLASLSLCTRQPQRVFSAFCKEIARNGPKSGAYIRVPNQSGVAINLSRFLVVLNDLSGEVIGSAAQAAVNLPEHLVYTNAVNRINVLNRDNAISLDRYIVAPYDIQERLYEESLRPMIFNKSGERHWPIVLPGGLWSDLSKEETLTRTQTLLVIASMYSKILTKNSAAGAGHS